MLNTFKQFLADERAAIWDHPNKVSELEAMGHLSVWLKTKGDFEIWANGTKFDLGMLEESYREFMIPVPWRFNADRCMRTLRKFAKPLDIEVKYEGIAHHALHDAIWQAKYIATACDQLELEL